MFGALFHTILIEQVFGLFLFIMSIILLSRVQFYRALSKNMKAQSGSVFISSVFGLALGLFLVVIHNIWVWEPRAIVSALCWVILIRAILWLSFPEKMVAMTKRIMAGKGYYFVVFLMFVIGVYLMTRGFYLFL